MQLCLEMFSTRNLLYNLPNATCNYCKLQSRFFTNTVTAYSKRAQLRKPNYSSLTKHLKPDGLTGRERRDLLRQKARKTKSKPQKVHVPAKRRLEDIKSDISPIGGTTSVRELSAKLASLTFDDLQLSPIVKSAAYEGQLSHIENPRPTEIQALAIPRILADSTPNIVCAAETGSGKTLAYLLPIIHDLKTEEENGFQRRLDHPRAIVLVPTRELTLQVCQTCKSMAHIAKFSALAIDSKTRQRDLARRLEKPVDILISTPTTLRSYIDDKTLSLADVQSIVIDEADSLFDCGWGDDVKYLIEKTRSIRSNIKEDTKTIIVTATLPKSVNRTLEDMFGSNIVKLTTPSLHRALPNLKQSFIDLSKYNGNRQMALLDVLKKNQKDEKTLVFCNTRKSAELLQDWLKDKNLHVLWLHKDVDRKETLELFAAPWTKEKGIGNNVLISTDLASRGLDTTFVDHVILYDFPKSVIDYLHRVGRTARAGKTGKATVLIGSKDRMMADRIRRSIREGNIIT